MTQSTTVDEKALVIFQDLQLTNEQQLQVFDLVPDFADREEMEQREICVFLKEQAAATTEGVQLRLPVIKILHAGANSFELPRTGDDEDGPVVREFEGVILDKTLGKLYWRESYGGGQGGPPDCASANGLTPYTTNPINPRCTSCKLNKFGSGVDNQGQPTRGKACRDVRRLYLKVDGYNLPLQLSVSAANIKVLDTYLTDLVNQGRQIGTVITRFKAVEAKNAAGVSFTGLELSTARRLEWDEMKLIKANVTEVFREHFQREEISLADDAPASTPSQGESTEMGKKAAEVM